MMMVMMMLTATNSLSSMCPFLSYYTIFDRVEEKTNPNPNLPIRCSVDRTFDMKREKRKEKRRETKGSNNKTNNSNRVYHTVKTR